MLYTRFTTKRKEHRKWVILQLRQLWQNYGAIRNPPSESGVEREKSRGQNRTGQEALGGFPQTQSVQPKEKGKEGINDGRKNPCKK